jgi:hypothetical protein
MKILAVTGIAILICALTPAASILMWAGLGVKVERIHLANALGTGVLLALAWVITMAIISNFRQRS